MSQPTQWDGDPDLRRVLLGLIRSGNAADTRNIDDAHALLMFGQSGEPLARALLDTIRDEVAVALGRAPAAASGSVCWKCGHLIRDAYMLELADGSGRVEHPQGCPTADVSASPPAAEEDR